MAQKDIKFRIGKDTPFLLFIEYKFVVSGYFSDYMKGLSALFSCRVACSEPLCFAPRFIASLRALQAPHSVFAINLCHYETQISYYSSAFHNRKRSSQLALEKHLQSFGGYFDVFLSARFYMLTIERRYLRKMTDKKQKEASLSSTKIEQLAKQPIIESYVSKSEDGKWLIHKTIVTDIKPVSYFEKVLAN